MYTLEYASTPVSPYVSKYKVVQNETRALATVSK